jgi:hypothetical protein
MGAAAGAILVAGSALATPIEPFTLLTPYGANINAGGGDIGILDYAPGSGLAVNANALGPGGAGSPIELLFQLNLASIADTTNNPLVATSTLNGPASATSYELTAVGRIWETAVGLGGAFATFSLAADPTGVKPLILEIYADTYSGATGLVPVPGTKATVLPGTGYDDGTLILTAVPFSMTSGFAIPAFGGNGVPDNQDLGIGSTQIFWLVTSFDPLFWTFPNGGLPVLETHVIATLLTPPSGTDTASMWEGTVPDYFTPLAAGTTPFNTEDLLFSLDGSLHFSVVPEPTTMILLGSGLMGLAGVARRRAKKA